MEIVCFPEFLFAFTQPFKCASTCIPFQEKIKPGYFAKILESLDLKSMVLQLSIYNPKSTINLKI